MKRLKIIALVLCLALSLAIVSGCDKEPKETATPTPTITTTPTNGTDNEDARQKEFNVLQAGQEIRIYHWFQPQNTEAFDGDDLISTYRRGQVEMLEEQYGVKITFIPFISDWFNTVCSSAYAGNPAADGMHAGGPHVLADHYYYQNIPGSCLEPLDDHGIDFSDDQYFQTEAQRIYGTFDGQLYYFINQYVGSKLIEEQQIVYVNYNLLSKGGYNKSDLLTWVQNGEWTWDKFHEVAAKCTDPNGNYWGTGRANMVENLLYSNNGTLVKEEDIDGVKLDRFAANSDECVQVYDFLIGLNNDNALTPSNVAGDDTSVQQAFAAGQVTFMFTYVNRIFDLQKNNPDFEYGFVLVPKGPNAQDYVSVKNWFDPFCVFKNTQYPAAVMKVMKEIYAPMFAKDSQEARDLYEAEVVKFCSDEQSKIMCDMSRDRVLYTKTATYSAVLDGITNPGRLESILKGEVTPKAYLESITAQMNSILDQILRVNS